jgi:hypothetical protein
MSAVVSPGPAAPGEIEVFRITPTPGKCYEHAECTRQTGYTLRDQDVRYYFRGQPRYVGKHVSHHTEGDRDDRHTWDIFDDNGRVNRVDYSYEGRTSFREVPCRDDLILRKVLAKYGIKGEAGTGPANIIRGFADIKPLPIGKGVVKAEGVEGAGAGAGKGGSRRRKTKRTHRNRRKTSRKY